MPSPSLQDLVTSIARTLQGGDPIGAARDTADLLGVPGPVKNLTAAYEVLNSLFHWLLNHNQYPLAARLIWSPGIFSAEPYATKLVWETTERSSSYLLMGAASMSKSYAGGAWHLLDWVRDPEYTSVKLIGPSEMHLEDNLFSHLVRMHRESAIPLPGQIGKLFIGLDPKERRSSISGIVMPPGKKGGKIQGIKRFPRTDLHPIFGRLSRLRVFCDEFEKIPPGIWADVDNVLSQTGRDPEGFKIGGAFNPEDSQSPCGIRCEPVNGWESIDRDKDDTWESKRGWDVARLNAMKSENVIAGKVVFEGLQTLEGVEKIVRNAGGWNAAGVYTMVYALFPPRGMVMNVIHQSQLTSAKGEFIWVGKTTNVGSTDPALEGGDSAFFGAGRAGLASGYRTFDGRVVDFLSESGQPITKPALQIDQLFPLPVGDTTSMAHSVKMTAIRLGIRPEHLMVDRTGNGAGVHDVLKAGWSPEVRGVNYSEGATTQRILTEDTATPFDEYERVWSELWFALKKWLEAGCVLFSPYVDTDQLFAELASRQYELGSRKKTAVESKKAYKDRAGKSPDRADAVTLLLHLVRVALQYVPSLTGEGNVPDPEPGYAGARENFHTSDAILDYLDD